MASTPSWLFVACVALAIPATPACTLDTFGASGAGPGPTASSSPTTVSAGSTAEATTPATTGVDASTANDGPSTTGAETSTTTVSPSTTTGVASSTTIDDEMTGVTTMTTTNETTGGPPPPKDPQPVAGPYESCVDNTPCDPSTDGCFTLTDANMIVTDGYCAVICDSVVDCGTKPQCPAVQECLSISVDQKVCALKCAGANDCPTGMICTNIVLSMGQSGTYCF